MANPQPEGFLALPTSSEAPGVLVLHAWWGLNNTIKSVCKQLADAGFVAFAPDLYHGKVADTVAGAEVLTKTLDANASRAKAEVREAAAFTSERARHHDRGLAVIGFSLGAYYALDVSTTDSEDVRRVVIFYGTGRGDFSRSKAAYLGHFAQNDPYESAADVAALEEALKNAKRPVTFHHYPGTGHWFFEPDRPQAYNETAAQLAWERTLAFLLRVAPRAS
jgi:carboxymethylenebutenolidase